MCTAPRYCSYCLERMKKAALANGNTDRANQLETYVAERRTLKEKPAKAVTKLDISSIAGKIAVDCDDTVGDFVGDMRQALAKRDGLTLEEALERYPSNPPRGIASWWEAEDSDPERSYKEFLDLEKRGLLYEDQPVREGAGEVLNWLNKETDGRVVFLTARPEAFNGVTAEWLREKVGVDFPISVAHSTKKEEVEDYAVLIDDSVPHVKAVTADTAPFGARDVVFMTRPRTAEAVAESKQVHAAWSWQDVKAIFTPDKKASS